MFHRLALLSGDGSASRRPVRVFWLARELGFLQTELSACCVHGALVVPATAGDRERGFLPRVRKPLWGDAECLGRLQVTPEHRQSPDSLVDAPLLGTGGLQCLGSEVQALS